MDSLGIFAPSDAAIADVEGDRCSVALATITLPKQQPRRYFDPDKMAQLVQSVQEHGILEPLLVRPVASGYELVAGERRLRAAQTVGLTEVPVVVRDLTDNEALQLALVENLQREDLNPVEATEGIISLLSIKLQLPPEGIPQLLHRLAKASDNVVGKEETLQRQTIEEVFQSVGSISWESFATHRLPLLNLPAIILDALRLGKLEYTKARAIAKLKDADQQQALLNQAITEGLSLNQIRAEVSAMNRQNQGAIQPPPALKYQFDHACRRLKKSPVWHDPNKQKQLKKLLAEIESLLEEA